MKLSRGIIAASVLLHAAILSDFNTVGLSLNDEVTILLLLRDNMAMLWLDKRTWWKPLRNKTLTSHWCRKVCWGQFPGGGPIKAPSICQSSWWGVLCPGHSLRICWRGQRAATVFCFITFTEAIPVSAAAASHWTLPPAVRLSSFQALQSLILTLTDNSYCQSMSKIFSEIRLFNFSRSLLHILAQSCVQMPLWNLVSVVQNLVFLLFLL